MISALNKLPDTTIELTITIPWKRVEESYQKTLADLAKKTQLKGFRKGKAPEKHVEDKLGKPAIYEQVLKTLIPSVYIEAIKEHKIRPIINPQIKVISLEEGKAWQIQATTCELPKVRLGDYRGEIRKASAAGKIWVPGTAKTSKPSGLGQAQNKSKDAKDNKLEKVFEALLKTAQVQIPSILIQDEVNRMLSRLIDQTNNLGLTVDQYLSSVGKTKDQLQEEYKTQAQRFLKLELILVNIADEQKIEIKDKEIEKMIQAAPDEKSRQAMDTPTQRVYIKQLLKKRAVIDNLMQL